MQKYSEVNIVDIMAGWYGAINLMAIPEGKSVYSYHNCSDGQEKRVNISKTIINHHLSRYSIECGFCDKCNTLFYVDKNKKGLF